MTHRSRAAAVAMLIVVALVGAACTQYSDRSQEGGIIAPDGRLHQFYQPQDRSVVEDFSGPSVTDDGVTVSLADYRDQVVVVNVWGSWCAPCRVEAPELERSYIANQANDVQFIGINVRETAGVDAAQDFIDAFGHTYPSIYDPPGRTLLAIGEEYPTTVVPMTFVLDRQHRVASVFLTTVSEADLNAAIHTVLGEP